MNLYLSRLRNGVKTNGIYKNIFSSKIKINAIDNNSANVINFSRRVITGRSSWTRISPNPPRPHFVSQHYLMLFFDITPFYGVRGRVNQIYSLFIQALKFYRRDFFLCHCPVESLSSPVHFRVANTDGIIRSFHVYIRYTSWTRDFGRVD